MSILDLDDGRNARTVDALAAKEGVPLGSPPDLGFFHGSASAPGKGLMRGIVAKPALLLGDAATPRLKPVAGAIDRAFGTNVVTEFLDGELRKNNQFLDEMKADPGTTGMAGQILHGLFDIGSSAIAFSPEGAAIMEGYAKRQELMEKGVRSGPATAAGVASGAALLAGVKAPLTMGAAAVGRGAQGVAANVSVGAGANVAAGVAERGLTSDILNRAGHKDLAKMYQPYDKQAMFVEATLGAVLSSGVGYFESNMAGRQGALNAALAVNKALHAARDTAPGIPVNEMAFAAHREALDVALEQTLTGVGIKLPESINEAQFLKAKSPGEGEIGAALREAYADVLPAPARHAPSDRLLQLPADVRRKLPFNADELNGYAASIEQKYGLPSGLINAIKNAGEKSGSESTSPKGAAGVMQFMPRNREKYGVSDVTDPVQAIDAAGRYLTETMKQYGGDINAVIADYNGGPRQARRVLRGEPPAAAETRAYLARVQQYLGQTEAPGLAKGKVALADDATGARQPVRDGAIDQTAARDIVPEITIKPRLTGEDLSGKTFDELETMLNEAVDHNKAVDLAGIRKFWGEEQAKEAEGWSTRQRETWILKNESEESLNWMQDRHINEGLIAEHRRAVKDFDPTDASSLGRSIANISKDIDEPGFFNTPAGNTFVSALRFAKEQGWNLDDVTAAMGARAAQWAVRDGPELFARIFNGTNRPGAAAIEAPAPNGLALPADRAAGAGRPAAPIADGIKARQADPGETAPTVNGARGAPASSDAVASQTAGERGAEAADLKTAELIAKDVGDMTIALDDGTAMPARQALADAQSMVDQAKTESRAFEAAVNCFLRRGA